MDVRVDDIKKLIQTTRSVQELTLAKGNCVPSSTRSKIAKNQELAICGLSDLFGGRNFVSETINDIARAPDTTFETGEFYKFIDGCQITSSKMSTLRENRFDHLTETRAINFDVPEVS